LAQHQEIVRELDIGYCFAKPYSGWESGAKENLNG
jgi:IS30 family transposase